MKHKLWKCKFFSEKLLTISTEKHVRCEQEHFMVMSLILSVSQPNVVQLSFPSKKRELIIITYNKLGLLIWTDQYSHTWIYLFHPKKRRTPHQPVRTHLIFLLFFFFFTLSGHYNKVSSTKPSLPCYSF